MARTLTRLFPILGLAMALSSAATTVGAQQSAVESDDGTTALVVNKDVLENLSARPDATVGQAPELLPAPKKRPRSVLLVAPRKTAATSRQVAVQAPADATPQSSPDTPPEAARNPADETTADGPDLAESTEAESTAAEPADAAPAASALEQGGFISNPELVAEGTRDQSDAAPASDSTASDAPKTPAVPGSAESLIEAPLPESSVLLEPTTLPESPAVPEAPALEIPEPPPASDDGDLAQATEAPAPDAGEAPVAEALPAGAESESAEASATQLAAKTPLALGLEDPLELLFSEGGQTLNATVEADLTALAPRLLANPEKRVQLFAYAARGDGSKSEARRLSLARARAVRDYLIDLGVPSKQIDLRALGDQKTKGPADRVDIVSPGG